MRRILITINILLCSSLMLMAQHTVSGTVVDERGESIPGVNIMLVGSGIGSITDIEGRYSIETPKNTGKLSYSFIGYTKHEEDINKRKTIDVMMVPNAELLDEVVAVGYSEMRKKDVTGSVGTIKAEDILKGSVSNYDQALAGRVAGVQVSASDGTPGAAMDIVIRGGNSITGDNSPLYVVDGLPMEDFDPGSISSHDIKDFDILKDASATAIYGSRGANGVIIITTKGGSEDGKTSVSFNASVGVQQILTRLEVMSPYDYVLFEKEVAHNKGYIDNFNEHWIDPALYTEAELAKRGENAVSYQDEIFRSGTVQNYNLSVSGGNKTSTIYYSMDYVDQEGTLLNTGYKRINNNLKFTHRLSEKAKVGGHINYSYINRIGQSISGNNRHSVILDAITFRPVSPIIPDGKDGGMDYTDGNELRFNPIKTLENTDRYLRQDLIRGNAYLDYNFTSALRLKLSASYSIDNRKESLFHGKDTYAGTRGNDGVNGKLTDRHNQNLSTSNTLTWKKKIHRLHDVSALAGFEAQQRINDFFDARNTQMPLDHFGTDKIQIGTQPAVPTSGVTSNTLVSFFGRLHYAYDDRYLLTVNFRADGSSKFRKENRWGYFPSFSAAWRVSEEDFIKDLGVFSNLKIRAGYGITGNNRVGDFVAYSQMDANTKSGYVVNNEYYAGVFHSNLAASNLKWETTKQSNFGLDMGFINNRINVVADYYKKNTTDLLLNAEMAPSVGYNQVYQNVGEVQNSGFELALNTVNMKSNAFTWTSAFNISFNKNKVIGLNSGQDEMFTNPDWKYAYNEYQYITRVGQPVGLMYGLQADGVYQMEDFVYNGNTNQYILKPGIPDNGANVAPGSAKFADQDGDRTINENDRVVIGNAHPKHFGGFSNELQYKDFDVSLFLQWSYGNDILNANRVELEKPSNAQGHNYLASVADRWTPENPSNSIHTIRFNGVYGAPGAGNNISDAIVEDGSFLRLKSLQLGYSLPRKALNRLRLDRCRFYVSAQNLYTWTSYSGFDPEVSVGKYGALTPGLDYSAYPMSATYTGGVQINF